MARSAAYRKYFLTINNPVPHGFTHDTIKGTLSSFANISYWCMCDEIGHQGTYHTHVYLCSPNAIQFATLQQRFYGAHIDPAKGSHSANRDYIRKEGKWLNDPKRGTSLPDTFEESGELPPERAKAESVSAAVIAMLKDGATNMEILECYPTMMTRTHHLDAARQEILRDRYGGEFRKLQVFYIWGDSGVGKTRSIMERYGYTNVYRITNYAHPFDNYRGQSIILFDEFRSQLPFSEMLNYLDGYPVDLPCRYADKVACYTTVFVVSNVPFEAQYPNIRREDPVSYKAFCRRFTDKFEMLADSADMPF